MKAQEIDLFRYIGILFVAAMAIFWFNALTASLELRPNTQITESTKTIFYDFWAEKSDVSRKTGVTIFEGNVKVKVRDSEDYLNADKVTIYRDVKTGELIKMEAVGKVDMSQKGMKATCERAIFYEKEERIELEGSKDSPAAADDGKNRMVALAITYYRKDDRIEAKGNVTGHVVIEEKKEASQSPLQEGESKAEEKGGN